MAAPYFEELTEYFSEKSGSDSRKSARFLLSNYVVNSSELVDGSDDDVVALKESDVFDSTINFALGIYIPLNLND